MPTMKKNAAIAALIALVFPTVFADAAVPDPAHDAKMISSDYVAPYVQASTYSFDESLVNFSKSALYEVKCQSGAVLSALGVTAPAGKKLTSVGYEQDGLNVNVDVANCVVNAYPTVWDAAQSKGISKESAVAAARKFAASFAGLTLPMGEPVVTGTDRSGYPIMYAKGAADANVNTVEIPVETDDQSDVAVDNLYQSVTVLFPYSLGKVPLHTTYGAQPEGLSVTVNGDGKITGAYGSAKFTLVKRTSEVLSRDGVLSAIRKRPLWLGQTGGEVKLSVQRALVQFDYAVGGANKRFISTGFFLKPVDAKWSNNGGIGVSDYVIGNPN